MRGCRCKAMTYSCSPYGEPRLQLYALTRVFGRAAYSCLFRFPMFFLFVLSGYEVQSMYSAATVQVAGTQNLLSYISLCVLYEPV